MVGVMSLLGGDPVGKTLFKVMGAHQAAKLSLITNALVTNAHLYVVIVKKQG